MERRKFIVALAGLVGFLGCARKQSSINYADTKKRIADLVKDEPTLAEKILLHPSNVPTVLTIYGDYGSAMLKSLP